MHTAGTPEQITALFQALIQAQAEFPSIPKTKPAYNYKYAPLPEIHNIIRPILNKHGLAVFHPINTRQDGKQAIGTTVIHSLGGSVSCDGLTIPEVKIQEQGGYVTYGSRYGYCSMLGITSQDDDEAALSSGKTSRQKRGGVAQLSRAPLTPVSAGISGDSGSSPDPSLPTKEERARYAKQLMHYAPYVDSKDLEGYVLGQSGASEGRLVKKEQWNNILQALDHAWSTGGETALKKLVGG